MEQLIRAKGLAKRYDGFALEGIDLEVPAGSVVGLIGSNGAGKTTTLKAILGMTAPDAGTVELLGCDPRTSGAQLIAVKQRIGVVLDACAFPVTMRVRDVGTLGRAAYPRWDQDCFEQLCERFELAPKKAVKGLSRGMGMKLTLAFALAHRPDLLVLDEATAGLDPLAREEVLDLLRRFMEEPGHAVLMSTHITTDLEKIADEVACIDEGRLVFRAPKDAICDEAGIARCRTADLQRIEELVASGALAEGRLRALRRGLATDVLVPDRFAFARALPDVPVDRASIEDYMTLALKGEAL